MVSEGSDPWGRKDPLSIYREQTAGQGVTSAFLAYAAKQVLPLLARRSHSQNTRQMRTPFHQNENMTW